MPTPYPPVDARFPNAVDLVVTKHDDGRLTADGFPEEIIVTADLEAYLDPRYGHIAGDRLYLYLSNGRAIYHLGDFDDVLRRWRGLRLYVKVEE